MADAAAALADLRYACHEACAQLLVAQAYRLELTGQRQELFAAFERHAAGLLRQRPDLPGAWALAAQGHCRLVDHYKAQVVRTLVQVGAAASGCTDACSRPGAQKRLAAEAPGC